MRDVKDLNIYDCEKVKEIHGLVIHSYLKIRGTQRQYNSKPLNHSIVKRILVFKR